MRARLLFLLLLMALPAAACRGADPEPAPTEAAAPAEPPPPPEPIRCPLTGVEAPAGVDVNRPPLAVKIDNHPRARPPVGLETADIVYEELVEGGLTRFLAIYHCGDAADLGPTRSARAVDPDILTEYAPVLFAYSGASPNVLAKVGRTAGVVNLVHGSNGPAYARRRGRAAPHNLFTSTDRIRARPAAQGVAGPPQTGLVFNPGLEVPQAPPPPAEGGEPAPLPAGPSGDRVSMSYSGAAVVSYTYDPGSRRYLRAQGGAPHYEASGRQLSAANVVVMKVAVDRRGSSPEISVLGTGEAMVLRHGEAIQGTWVRQGFEAKTTLVDAAGAPIELAAGNTWINLVPNDRPATLE